MALLKRIRLLAAKVETTPGTAIALSASDASFNAYDIAAQPTIPINKREGQGGFGYLPSVPGGRMGVVTFKTDLGWDGTSTVPTWASVLLPACGWVDSSGTFTPRSESIGSNVKTLTMAVYQADRIKKIIGAVGTFQVVLPAGGMPHIEWTFTGAWEAVADGAILTPTHPTAAALRWGEGTMTFASVAQKVSSATIDAGNNVVMREDPATASGYVTGVITNREVKITADPESTLVATDDPYGDWLSATEAALAITVKGPEGGTSDAELAFNAPKAQIENSQEGDRNRIETDDLTWGANKNGATQDQELSIVFTPLVA